MHELNQFVTIFPIGVSRYPVPMPPPTGEHRDAGLCCRNVEPFLHLHDPDPLERLRCCTLRDRGRARAAVDVESIIITV